MRFLSAQLVAYLENDLWLRNARQANAAATALAAGFRDVPGARVLRSVDANEVFVALPAPTIAALEAEGFGFYRWPVGGTAPDVAIRLVTSYATREGDVAALLRAAGRAALCVAFLANLTAFPLTNGLLPYVAREIFHTDQTGLGYLSASFAVGSLIGSITVSLAGGLRIARLLIGATFAWYAMLLVFVELKTMPVAMACLVLAGIAQSMSMISAAVILMRAASAHLRGRVMGVRMMVIYGLPIGLLAAGSLIDLIGYSATGTLYASAGLIAMMAIALYWRIDLWPLHAPANAR